MHYKLFSKNFSKWKPCGKIFDSPVKVMFVKYMYLCLFKRLIDFIIAFFALVIVWPILLLISIWLYFANKGAGIFFLQERPGKDEKIFKVIKFKTMTDERGADGNLLSDKERLTKIGKFVRSTSIDELPQLINVLKGDMSLIGPRPLLPQYLPLYSKEQVRRHEVRPGITGWAQVNGRNAISWTKKFELDVWYVDHCSFLLDLKIVFMTIKKVFVREGISSDTSATMEAFTGDN
jgi:undecaprenyl phosphate N,N'-diacetylbacillosamine 1-phosphate transferase